MKERYLLAGNWKMNCLKEEAFNLIENIKSDYHEKLPPLVIGPPFPWLMNAVGHTAKETGISIAAQNCHHESKGAFTGEVSADMLASCGVEWVILGHSERRQYFGEDDILINRKIEMALEAGLKVIYCCGEGLKIREAGEHISFVSSQLEKGLYTLDSDKMRNVVIAYEPVWAIGTGRTAEPEQAQEMHSFIRNKVKNHFGDKTGYRTTILYGGSCKPTNAADLFRQEDVDGGLIGGASLNAEDFLSIAASFPD